MKFTMKTTLLTALFMTMATVAHAQNGKRLDAPAVIEFKQQGMRPEQIWIAAATPTTVYYDIAPDGGGDLKQIKRDELATLHLFESKDYLEALDLYQGRKYDQAKEAFAKVAEKFKPIAALPNNPATMAGFYEMECMRKLGDLEGLRKALQTYDKGSLTMKVPQQQLEVYVLWDAVRAKTWQLAEKLGNELKTKKFPGSLRAQIAYCLGLASEGLKKPQGEALLAYQTAITADAGASEVIAHDACLRILEILNADADLKDAKNAFDASKGEDMIKGYTKLIEAAGVASMYEMGLGNGKPLPDKFQYLLKYKLKTDEAKKEKKDETKKDDAKKDDAKKDETKKDDAKKGDDKKGTKKAGKKSAKKKSKKDGK